jgi:hypothetical protein
VLVLTPVAAVVVGDAALGNGHCTGPGQVPVSYTAAEAPAKLFEVEGPITQVDLVARTITANGMEFVVPGSAGSTSIATVERGGAADITLEHLVDDTRGPVSYLGATVIASGDVVVDDLTGCATFRAGSAPPPFVEPAENVLVGLLDDVVVDSNLTDGDSSSFTINGARVQLNKDPRFGPKPAPVLASDGTTDLGLAGLAGHEGEVVTAEGHMSAGTLLARLVETEIAPPPTAGARDTVVISSAQHADGKLRVRGTVSRLAGTTAYTSAVDVYAGGLAGSGRCAGYDSGAPRLATSSVAADGAFDARARTTRPASVCAQSRDGLGAATRTL